MSSAGAALLSSVLHHATPLRTIARIHVRLVKNSSGQSQQASLRHFVEKRLPVLRFHNPQLKVDIARLSGPSSTNAPGIQVVRADQSGKGERSYLLPYQNLRDDEIFASIVALDKATTPEAEAAISGVVKGELPKIEQKTTTTAAEANELTATTA